MSRKIILFFLLVLLAITAISAWAQADTIVRLPETDIALNRVTTLDVMLICPASNCIGIDVTVAYDPAVISVDEVTPGDFLGDSPRVIVSGTDNTPGTFRFAALSSASASRPAEGVIFTIELTGTSLGESDLTVTSLSIFRRGGTLQASSEKGLIRVTEDAQVAEDETATPGERPTLLLSRRLTVRSGPGPQFSASATVEPNAELEVLGISGDGAWFLVALPGGSQGWLASSRFATLTGNIADIPIVSDFVEIAPEVTDEEPTSTPTDTPEPPTPTDAATIAPIETEEIAPVQTDTATEPPTSTPIPSNTPVPIGPTVTQPGVETKEPLPTEELPSPVPTDTPEPPEPTATNTSIPPTATLRTDTEAQIAPPATETSVAVSTSTSVPTNTPLPTLTPSPTNTPEPPTPTFTATIPEPCTISTTATNVPVSVGPNRVIRTTFPVNQIIRVTGQQQADDGSLWWRIEPLGNSQEVDRFWVRQSDVTAQGGCDIVEDVDAPQVISGGGNSGSQFSGTFRSGQNFATHSFSVAASGTYQIICGGSPTYPEFSVGSNQSRGQTTISTNLSAGRHTLTVFSSTINAGQMVFISNYGCSLSRR